MRFPPACSLFAPKLRAIYIEIFAVLGFSSANKHSQFRIRVEGKMRREYMLANGTRHNVYIISGIIAWPLPKFALDRIPLITPFVRQSKRNHPCSLWHSGALAFWCAALSVPFGCHRTLSGDGLGTLSSGRTYKRCTEDVYLIFVSS